MTPIFYYNGINNLLLFQENKFMSSTIFKANYYISISIIAVLILTTIRCKNKEDKTYVDSTEVEMKFSNAKFVGKNACIECHQEEFDLWQGSHHDQAMKIADSSSILADFNNTKFFNKNVKSTFFIKDGDYFVNLESPNGDFQDYKIVYT